MKIRLSLIVVSFAAALSGAALIGMSQKVQVEEGRLGELQEAVKSEAEMIRVLEAEWSYLNRPERIERLAQKYLRMSRTDSEELTDTADTLPDLFVKALPVRKPAAIGNRTVLHISAEARPVTAGPAITSPRAANPASVKAPPVSSDRGFSNLLGTLTQGEEE